MTAAQDALPRTRLAVAMNARGWSQADVIRRLRHAAELRGRRLPSDGTMTSQLSRWARGVHRPDAFHRSLFREVLHEDLFSDGDDRLPTENQPAPELLDDGFLTQIENAAAVDNGLVHELQSHTDALRQQDRRCGARLVIQKTAAHLLHVENLLRYSVAPASRRNLARVVADTAALAAWQSLDAGDQSLAWARFEIAKTAAREAGDHALLAFAGAEQAYVLLDVAGSKHDAIEIIRSHHYATPMRLPAALRSWLFSAEAEAAAAAGSRNDCMRALEAADRIHPGETEGELPYLSLSGSHLARWRGHCLTRLGEPDAVATCQHALNEHDGAFIRARAGLLCDLATGLLAYDEHEAANVHLAEAKRLAARIGSVRQQHRIRALQERVA